MPNINVCVFAGHLGKDPEVRYTSGGTGVMSFSLAVNRRVKKGDQWENETDWIPVIHWKPSEFIINALHKGTACLIHGRLQTRKYEKDGQQRTAWEIVAEKVDPLGGKTERSDDTPVSAPRSSRQQGQGPNGKYGALSEEPPIDGLGIDDTDVPF